MYIVKEKLILFLVIPRRQLDPHLLTIPAFVVERLVTTFVSALC